ncbi:MAG: zf-TFIIB domain-containing protein [Myxococcota bacterium]
MSSIPCPRCSTPLDPCDIEGVPVDRCPTCTGMLVEQKHLSGWIDALVKLMGPIGEDTPIQVVPDAHGIASCPDCGAAMERFGYLEARVVTLDRCRPCQLVWIDEGELPTMVAMVGRSSARANAQLHEIEELGRRLSAMFRSRVRG